MYKFLRHKLASLPQRRLSADGLKPAAVLLAISDADEPEIILTQRSIHLSTHQGQVAFPGGKCDVEDQSEAVTALREAHEEVALAPALVQVVGALGQVYSRHGFVVTPIVGVVPQEALLSLAANPDELDHVFTVPVDYFLTQKPQMRSIQMLPGYYQVPTFEYNGFTIWGMTAFVLAEFLNHVYDADFPLQQKP
ncbi:MAG: CoA pyrophosphatase [Gammaproteobacteria bacterium]|jgi:8-oxo-dGTP pyrophosphatase MutT (NUDIX family)|nr:CoA pyrophosphatase [Gammaproteobacteria bacterium]